MKAKKLLILLTAVLLSAPFAALAAGVPETVTNVTATAVDATSAGVSWDAAKDAEGKAVDHYRIYYGATSIITEGAGEYDEIVDTPNNSTTYVVTGLTPETTYYFSVTGFSEDGLESEEYSWEGEATTPAEGEADEEASEEEKPDIIPPTVVSVSATDQKTVQVTFSEAVQLPAENPETAFTINEQLNSDNALDVTAASVDEEDEAVVVLKTATQTPATNYIVTAGVAVEDAVGNPIVSGNTDQGIFAGSEVEAMEAEATTEDEVEAMEEEPAEAPEATDEEEEEDTTPPENVTDLMLSFKEQVNTLFTVLMDWTPSIDSAQDLVDQIVYMSTDRGNTYNDGESLGDEADSHEVRNLEGGKEYTFKVTTKDEAGNESTGAIKAIRLPQSGFGAIALIPMSIWGAAYATRRRRK